ncbi:MAG: hypothetical protein LBQ22_01955 [Bacteroidales bacterium]|jgi:hypothetical protein|nr:hypothetical protein [Bacteroidales bacterium]
MKKRSASQNKHLYWLFSKLNIKNDTKADLAWHYSRNRSEHTSDLSYIECQQLINDLEKLLCKQEKNKIKNINSEDIEKLDKYRKGLIKAIFSWYDLQNKKVDLKYVKATACRAAGVEKFNDITILSLTRLYGEFCRKQTALDEINSKYFKIGLN